MAFEFAELFNRQNRMVSGAIPPTSGAWNVGDIVQNESPAAGEPATWVCTAAGSPGTWLPCGHAVNTTPTAIAAAGTISPADTVVDVGTGGFDITLAAPTSAQNGAEIIVVNDTGLSVTLTPVAGVTLYAGSAVLTTNTSATLRTVNGNYYRG